MMISSFFFSFFKLLEHLQVATELYHRFGIKVFLNCILFIHELFAYSQRSASLVLSAQQCSVCNMVVLYLIFALAFWLFALRRELRLFRFSFNVAFYAIDSKTRFIEDTSKCSTRQLNVKCIMYNMLRNIIFSEYDVRCQSYSLFTVHYSIYCIFLYCFPVSLSIN